MSISSQASTETALSILLLNKMRAEQGANLQTGNRLRGSPPVSFTVGRLHDELTVNDAAIMAVSKQDGGTP